jgi:hypothetical protein
MVLRSGETVVKEGRGSFCQLAYRSKTTAQDSKGYCIIFVKASLQDGSQLQKAVF